MIGNFNMKQKGERFMWFFPPSVISATLMEEDSGFVFEGAVRAFKQIGGNGVVIRRRIQKMKASPEWEITDTVERTPSGIMMRQLWHTDSDLLFVSNGDRIDKKGWCSDYYGVKRTNKQIEFLTQDNQIETKIYVKQ